MLRKLADVVVRPDVAGRMLAAALMHAGRDMIRSPSTTLLSPSSILPSSRSTSCRAIAAADKAGHRRSITYPYTSNWV